MQQQQQQQQQFQQLQQQWLGTTAQPPHHNNMQGKTSTMPPSPRVQQLQQQQQQQSNLPRHLQGLPRAGANVTPMQPMNLSTPADPRRMSVGSAATMSSLRSPGKSPMPFPPKMIMKAPITNPAMKVGPTVSPTGNQGKSPSNTSSMENAGRGRNSIISPTAMRAAVATPSAAGTTSSRRNSDVDPRIPLQQGPKSTVSPRSVSDDAGGRYRPTRGGMVGTMSIDSGVSSSHRNAQQPQRPSILVQPQHQQYHNHHHHQQQQQQQQHLHHLQHQQHHQQQLYYQQLQQHQQYHQQHQQHQQHLQSTMAHPTPSLSHSGAEGSPSIAKKETFWQNVKTGALNMLGAKSETKKSEVMANISPTRYARGGVNNNNNNNSSRRTSGSHTISPRTPQVSHTGNNNTADDSNLEIPMQNTYTYESERPRQQQQQQLPSPSNRTNQQSMQQSQQMQHQSQPMQHRTSAMHSLEANQNRGKAGTTLQGSAAAIAQNNNNNSVSNNNNTSVSNNTSLGPAPLAPRPSQTTKTIVIPTASPSSVAASSDVLLVSPSVQLRDEVREAGIAPSSVVQTSKEGGDQKSLQSLHTRRVLMFPSMTVVDSDEDSSEVSADNKPQLQEGNQMEKREVDLEQKQDMPPRQMENTMSPAETPERQKLESSNSSLVAPSALTLGNTTHEERGEKDKDIHAEGGTASTQLHSPSEGHPFSSSGVSPQQSILDKPIGAPIISDPKAVDNVNDEVSEKKKKKKIKKVIPKGEKSSPKPTTKKVSSKEMSNKEPLDEKKTERRLLLSPEVRKRNSTPVNHKKDYAAGKGHLQQKEEHHQSQRQHSLDSLVSSEASLDSLETQEKKKKKRIHRDKSQDSRRNSSVSPPRRNSTFRVSPLKDEKKTRRRSLSEDDKKKHRRRSRSGSSNSSKEEDYAESRGRSPRRHSTSPTHHSHTADKKKNKSRGRSSDDDSDSDNDRGRRRSSLHSLTQSLFRTRDVYKLYRELKRQQHQIQRERLSRWRKYGTTSLLDSHISPNKSGEKSPSGHNQSPKPWRHTSLHTPPVPPVTPLRRPLGYISLGNGSYRPPSSSVSASRRRKGSESGRPSKSPLRGGESPISFRSSPISARYTPHTINNNNHNNGVRNSPLHSYRHMPIPLPEEENQRGDSTIHPYELVTFVPQRHPIDPHGLHKSPNGNNYYRDGVGSQTWMRCERTPERRGLSPIRRFNDVKNLQNSQRTSHHYRRSSSLPERRYSTGESQHQQQHHHHHQVDLEMSLPVFTPPVSHTSQRSSSHQIYDKHEKDQPLHRRCSGETALTGYTHTSSHSIQHHPSSSPPIITNTTTNTNTPDHHHHHVAVEASVSLSSSTLGEDVFPTSFNRGNINSNGVSGEDEPIPIPVVDLRKEFKPHLETSARSREPITTTITTTTTTTPSKIRPGYGVKNISPSRCRSNHHTQSTSTRGVLSSRHYSQQRSARGASRSPTRYVDIPEEKMFSSFDIKEPERPSAWAMGPERSNLPLNSPRTRRRVVKKMTSSHVIHSGDDMEMDKSSGGSGSDGVKPVLIVEELRLDEQRRPYMLIREVPYGPAAVAAQRDSVERLSRPRPVYVRREDGTYEENNNDNHNHNKKKVSERK
ncbi:uncharacterized protein TM35_000381320 [Trypanosoma theileri]|uniref:Uncharacterized protein n=1 Tax=Trypanosoma theileri TaxID=67003 RepID=A0A1X0NK78_9TRYP|nr:uncharacterized protein TM35_000381320 [Trypanosoma theileri]ORC85057.1 hypothetical protein TM35_000381320 [Trypanosoma theileri]